jgi:hypothetical protein
MEPDCTLNGHNSSLWGIYEYSMVTKDDRARQLFLGAVTTTRHYLPSFRRSRWISRYCLAHRAESANYHHIHVGQLLELYQMTGALVFARAADAFESDYPDPAVAGSLHVEPGTYTALTFGADDRVVGRRTVRFRRAVDLSTARRQRHKGRPAIDLRVSDGPLAGWWLPEMPDRVYLEGMAARVGYKPARALVVDAGESLSALAFDESGRVLDSAPIDPGEGLRLSVDRSAVVNGWRRVRLSGGDLDGYWLVLRPGVRLI